MRGKKGSATAIIIIIIIVIFLGWIVHEGAKECKSNSDCRDNQYCSSQFTCEDFPTIEYGSPQVSNSFAWIIGISLIIAALIMKWDTIFKKKEKKSSEEEKKKEPNMEYHGEEKGEYQDELDEE